jgi:TonB family protein
LGAEALKHKAEDYWLAGISLSVFGHLALAWFLIFKILPGMGDFGEPIVYSISIEPSKDLGGITQLPKDNKKSPVAPPKNISASSSDSEPEVKPEKLNKPEKPVEPPEDAEVSTSDTKPTPQPPKPTPEPAKPTPQPSKPTPKPTAVPTRKAEPTPKPTKDQNKQKSDGDKVDKQLQSALQRYLGPSVDAGSGRKNWGGASKGGTAVEGGANVRPPEFFVYEKIVRSRIKEAWRWYDTNTTLITQVAFEIDPDGRTTGVRITQSSGNSSFDDSVVRAVIKASPLPPPPESVYQFFKSVRVTFDPRD